MQRLTQTTGSGSTGRFGARASSSADLAQRLFEAPERWGWEYDEPRPPQPHPNLANYPRWIEPMGADIAAHQSALALAQARLRKLLIWAAGLLLLALMFSALSGGFAAVLFLAALGLGGFAVYQVNAPQQAIQQAEREARLRRDEVHANFVELKRKWDKEIAEHDEIERARHASDPLLFPLAPDANASRVDVVGGAAGGWSSLLATMGSSMLAAGETLLVLDLSRNDVTGPLASLADDVRTPRQRAAVPAALEAPWMLGDLQPRQLADVLAAAIDSMRGENESVSLAASDAEIIRTVAMRIARPLTFARLAAGVRVLRAVFDVDEETVLSAAEVAKIAERADILGQGEQMRTSLAFVESQLDVLAATESGDARGAGDAASLWPSRGLAVLRSDDLRARGRDSRRIVDRVAFETVAHRLADGRVGAQNPTLVVVGADDLGRSALEEMAQNAYRAEVRLIYFFEHLKRDTLDLIGGGDSVAVLMRMGNGEEAQKAAEFIGQGFKFHVSQLSKQVGDTITKGTNRGTTKTTGGAYMQGTNRGRSYGRQGGGSSEGTSESYTESWSTASTVGSSWSEARSENNTVTLARSREFTVEATQIQGLEPTAFLLVDSGPQGRRVRLADSYPGSVFVPRRSSTPR